MSSKDYTATTTMIPLAALIFATNFLMSAVQVVDGQIGMVCSKNSDCKMGSSFVCGPQRSCQCDRGHRFDLFKFTCVRNMVNHKQRCDPSRDVCKGGPHAVCTANFLGEKPVCQCEHGYVFHQSTELCQNKDFVTEAQPDASTGKPEGGVPQGGFCTTNADCRGYPNATCYYFVGNNKRECDCKFESHYYDHTVANCVPKKSMGSACSSGDECINVAHVECSKGSNTCGCKMDFYFDPPSQTCKPSVEIGENCQSDHQCKARPNSHCQQPVVGKIFGRCDCLPGKRFYEGGRTCVEEEENKTVSYGHPCMPSSKCEGGEFAECKNTFIGMNPICTCKDGYEFDSGPRLCRREGEVSHPEDPSSGDSDNNINLDLKFNIFLKVVCNTAGDCKTTNATVT